MHIQTKHHFCWRLMYSKWVQQFPMFFGSAMETPLLLTPAMSTAICRNELLITLQKPCKFHIEKIQVCLESSIFSQKKKSPKEGVNFPPKSSKNCLKQQVCYPYSKYFEYQYLDCYLCILAHVFVASTHRNPNLLLALRSTCTAWLYSNQAATGRTLGKCSEWWGGSCHCKGYIYVLYSIYNIIIYIIYSPSGPYKSNKSPQLQVANKTKDAYPLTIKLPLHLLWCPEKKRICQSIIEVRQGGIHVTFNKHKPYIFPFPK